MKLTCTIVLCALAALPLRAVPLKQPAPMPAWQLKDVDGNPVSSADFKGKVLVVDFWATTCAPCLKEIPGYVALQARYGAAGLVFVGISTDDGGPKAPALVKKYLRVYDAKAAKEGRPAFNYRILMATADVEAAFGGLDGVPTTFIVDRQGRIRDKKVGLVPAAAYEKTLLGYLRE
ncbi:MAG TPA: TlpA disulfide reductase family protein [Opitutaceae bacterium]|nr:TlpA disulfide reductase family protein [Opitutaceae bacterium]